MMLRPGLLLALATLAGTSFAQPAPPRRDLSTMDRFEWAAPLSVPPIKVHRMARHGLAQSVATSRGLQGRVLWIDATANVGRVNSDEKIAALMKQVAEIGFNTVVYDVKPILGYTMYPSRLTDQITRWRDMRMDPGYDPLAAMLREGKKNGLNVMVALNAFSEGHRFSTRDANLPENPFFKPGWGDSQPDLQTVRYLADPTWRGFAVEEAVNPPQIGTGIAIYSRVPNGPARTQGEAWVSLSATGRVLSVGREAPAELTGGAVALWTARGAAAEALRGLTPGQRVTVTPRVRFVRIGEAQNQIPLMMNPHRRENVDRALAFIREIAQNYPIDGLLYDDRLRFGGLDADFSDFTRKEFERFVGRTVKWPEEIYEVTFTPDLRRGIRPGPLYDAFLTFRTDTMQRFIAAARAETKRHRPAAIFGIYAGSWYGDYARYGSNYASPDLNAGFPFLTRAYRQTGFAPLLDVLITGCYYPQPTAMEALENDAPVGRTVEAGGIISNRVARDKSWVYAGIMISDFFNTPERFGDALQAAAATTQGVMVFDLSHRFDEFAPVMREAFRRPAAAPHVQSGLIEQIRRERLRRDQAGFPEPPFPMFEGAPGTGF